MSKFAYVTLLLNSDYLPGTLTLCQSLKDSKSTIPIVLLLSKSNITNEIYEILNRSNYFDRIINIDLNLFETRNEFELKDLLKRGDLSQTLTKLNIWKLTDYDRLIYLDSDILIHSNIDHLFEIYPQLHESDIIASSDSGWPDIFNSGLFIIKPSTDIYDRLIKFYQTNDSFDGADQGLLNEFFNLRSHETGCNWFRLPFVYNCTLNSNYEYLPALIRFQDSIKIFHFIGLNKPWKNHNLCYDPTYIRIFNNHSDNLFKLWWNVFDSVHIEGFTLLDILQYSYNLQSTIEPLSLTDTNEIVEIEETPKNVIHHNEIVNPFLSPTIQPQSDELKFPTFYYKKPNNESIKDESSKGEAWKMDEGKIDWPQNEREHDCEIINESPVDRYVNANPIFPWETNRNVKKSISRTFTNALEFKPPAYSISIMNDDDDEDVEDEVSKCLDSDYEDGADNDDGIKLNNDHLVGFQDGEKFERYLNKVERINKKASSEHLRTKSGLTPQIQEEINDLQEEINEGLKLQEEQDKELEDDEKIYLNDDVAKLDDVKAFDQSLEDNKIEAELDDLSPDLNV